MCGGMDAGGSVELCSMWSLIRNASEKHGVWYTGSYSDISLTLIKTKGPIFMLTWYCPPAVPSDHITALTGDPKEIISIRQLEEPDGHPYEWLDKMLNSICGEYAKRNGIMPSAMRQGPMGLPGLCNTLQYFVEKGFASDEILETCINNLIEEAKKVYVTIYIPRKTQHSWCVTFSDLE